MVTGLPHRIEGTIQTQILKEVPYHIKFIRYLPLPDFVFCCRTAYSAELF